MDTDSSVNERMLLFVAVSIDDIDAVLSELHPRGGRQRSNSAPPAVFKYPPSFWNTPFNMELSAPRVGHSDANIGELAGEPGSAITLHGAAASTVSPNRVEEDQHPDSDVLPERKVRAVYCARADVRMSLNGILTVYENADRADCIQIIAQVSDSQKPVRHLLEFEIATATVQLLLQPCRNSGTGSDADRGVFCLEGLLNERNVIEASQSVLSNWPLKRNGPRHWLRWIPFSSGRRAATTTLDVFGALFLMLREFGNRQLSEPTSRLNVQKAFETAVKTLSRNALSYIQAQEERRRCLSLALDARGGRKCLSAAERMDIALALKEPCHVSSPLPIDLEDDCMRVLNVLEYASRNRDGEEGLAKRASSDHLEERTRRGRRGRISGHFEESHTIGLRLYEYVARVA
ncbi:hypothetical protein EV122DRAFT_254785 [Schizophyllum commune]